MATEHESNRSAEKRGENQIEASYERLVRRLVKWAETCPDIRAAVIVGSRARVDHPADEWADLDVLLVVLSPESYLSKIDWLGEIGNPVLTFLEPTATGGEMERRVLFEGMLDVDFSIVPKSKAQQLLRDGVPPEVLADVSNTFGRGVRVLLDKDRMVAQLQKVLSSTKTLLPSPPTQREFLDVVSDFLYHAVFTAKHLRRGELWWAKMCCDCYMHRLLLRMIEWHARVTYGMNYDTWFRGRFLEKWADPRVLKELRSAFAHYDEEDVKRALLAVMGLFRWLATEISEKLGYSYPIDVDKHIAKWISNSLSVKAC